MGRSGVVRTKREHTLRAYWNIRVQHLPDPRRVPFRCHLCGSEVYADFSAEVLVKLVVQLEERVRCPVCQTSHAMGLAVAREDLRWEG